METFLHTSERGNDYGDFESVPECSSGPCGEGSPNTAVTTGR